MGCASSKLDNEDTVRRCKDRRRFINSSVSSRHNLAAAHSDYCRSLRLTGYSLAEFAKFETLIVANTTPSVHINTKQPITHRHVSHAATSSSSHQNYDRKLAHQVKTKLPRLLSESSLSDAQNFTYKANANSSYRNPAHPVKPKLPHILSESSPHDSPRDSFHPNFTYKANADYSETQSQTDGASSAWNWENFYPPSPPGSEFFEKRNDKSSFRSDSFDKSSLRSEQFRNKKEDDKSTVHSNSFRGRDRKEDDKSSVYSNSFRGRDKKEDDKSSVVYSNSFRGHDKKEDDKSSVYSEQRSHSMNHGADRASDFFDMRSNKDKVSSYNFKQQRNNNNNGDEHHHLNVDEDEGEETEREEVQYSEWDDHYNSTTSSSSEGDERESLRSEIRVPREYVKPERIFDDGGSSVNKIDMRMVVRHRDLAEIVAAIREYFDKAASAGEQVGEMLETGRAQMDRSFSKLKKTVYHSSNVFSNLSSSWTSKPPLAVKYQFEPSSIVEPGGSKSLCSTLERLLAWEKKLYQEVKAREGVKIENEKKLSSLQSQECRGDNEVKLDKTKTEIKRLQSLIVVTSQAVSTTSSAIIGVRDAELVPQLVELCHGFMYMWRSMNQFHEVQNQIVQQVRGLVNQSMKGEATSDLHRQATRDLESAVSAWHSSFCRLIKFQRDFIRNLHGWFKLTLLPINGEPFNGNMELSEAFSFYDEWKLALERVPDTVASEAIKSFINVVHSISLKQTEELKIKKRTESVSKELEKKSSSLRNIEKKYYHSYSMVGIGLPDTGPDNGHVLDARDPLAEKKFELESCRRKVEDEMLRHSKAVEVTRAMTLNNIQTGLPGVFQAMTSFSALIMEALETVCTRSYAIK